MALNSSDTNVSALVINKCTKAQYDAMPSHSLNELYLVPEADDALRTVTASGSGYVTLTAGAKTGEEGAMTQALTASLTVQPVSTADGTHMGLAEASDVRTALENAGIVWTEL